MNIKEVIIELKMQQAVMDAVLDELGRRAVFIDGKAKLVADRCGQCAKLKDCEKGYCVNAGCGDWEYKHVIPAGIKRESSSSKR